MSDQWVINPAIDMVSVMAQYGRFLEDDYRMVIESLYIPETFIPIEEKSGRKFVIVGGKENPILLARTIFLCIKLAQPDSIAVKTDQLDESFIAQNILDNHGHNIKHSLFTAHHDNLKLDDLWLKEIEDATDIVVFGDEPTMSAFRDYETVDRRVWEYGEKFSFGVVKAEAITQRVINEICFDFFSFYGVGRLAPKFYFVIGKITKKIAKQFSDTMIVMHRFMIEQYRAKLPLTQKSELVQLQINSNYVNYYVRVEKNNSKKMFDSLYGDVRLVPVNDVDDVKDFIEKWSDNISSVAVNIDDDWEILDMLEDMQVNRICAYGDMQFPDFFEQYDSVDDYIIYPEEGEQDDDDFF